MRIADRLLLAREDRVCGRDPGTEMFWADIPDGAPNLKKCDNTTFPVVQKKTKTGSGDLQFTLCVPYPWDGGGGWR